MNGFDVDRDTVTPMAWSDAFLLGYAAMDETHREFVACVAALQTAGDDDIAHRLADFERHAQRHFDDEQKWMDRTAFPAAQCHVEEHAAVLNSVQEVTTLLNLGADPQVARDLADALANWFPGHADYMDAALSHWLSKHMHGGAPVVVRRNVTRQPSPGG